MTLPPRYADTGPAFYIRSEDYRASRTGAVTLFGGAAWIELR
jgi:hypothetical protein